MINVNENSLEGVTAPNVYIKKIQLKEGGSLLGKRGFQGSGYVKAVKTPSGTSKEVYSRSQIGHSEIGSTSATVHLVVKDIINHQTNKGTWSTSPSSQTRFNLRCFMVFNKDLESYLLSTNAFDGKAVSIPSRFNQGIDWDERVLSLSAKESAGIMREASNDSKNSIVSKEFTCTFGIPQKNPGHLSCFSFCEYLPPDTAIGNRIHSMIVVEKIIEESSVVKRASIFRTSTGQLWGGPLHYHLGRPMEGAFHTARRHSFLTEERVYNCKIQDFRVFSRIDSLKIYLAPTPQTRRTNYLSDLFLTRDTEGNAIMAFNFDADRILQHQSRWGTVLSQVSPQTQRAILADSPITSIAIVRDRVRTTTGMNRLRSTAKLTYDYSNEDLPRVIVETAQEGAVLRSALRYNAPGEKSKQYKQINLGQKAPGGYLLSGRIQEVNISNVGSKRTAYVVDSDVSRITDGIYQYEVQIKIKDGILPFMRAKLRELENATNAMNRYISIASRTSNYDYRTNRFKDAFIKQYATEREDVVTIPKAAIAIYLEALSLVTNMEDTDSSSLANDLYSVIEPMSSTLDSNKKFLEYMTKLSDKFGSLISAKRQRRARDKSAIRQGTSPSDSVSLSAKFPQLFDADLPKNTGIDYLNFEPSALPQLSILRVADLKQGIDLQLRSFNTTKLTENELLQSGLSTEEIGALTDQKTKYSYASPNQIILDGKKISLTNQKEIDYASVNVAVQSVLTDLTSKSSIGKGSPKIHSVLKLVGKGDNQDRLDKIKDLYVEVAQKSNVTVMSQNPDLSEMKFNTISSEQFVGGKNTFSSVQKSEVIQSTTKKIPQEQYSDATSVLENIILLKNINVNGGREFSSTPPLDISFDVSKSNNFIAKNIRPMAEQEQPMSTNERVIESLRTLPQQVKDLTLSKGSVFADNLATNNDAKTSAFSVLVSSLRAIEYLHGYKNNAIKNPDWRILENVDSLKGPVLCRLARHDDPSVGIDPSVAWDKIPVQNEYFILVTEDGTLSRGRQARRQEEAMPNGLFYDRARFVIGRSNLIEILFRRDTEKNRIQRQVELTSTSMPSAPTGLMGKISGLVEK